MPVTPDTYATVLDPITAIEFPQAAGDFLVKVTWRFRAGVDSLYQVSIFCPTDLTADFPLDDSNGTRSLDVDLSTYNGSDLTSNFLNFSESTIGTSCGPDLGVWPTNGLAMSINQFDSGPAVVPPSIPESCPTEMRLGSGPELVLELQSVVCDDYFPANNQHENYGTYAIAAP